MQSKIENNTDQLDFEAQLDQVVQFNQLIAVYVQTEQWQLLSEVLTERQVYLEMLINTYDTPEQVTRLRFLSDSIMDHDNILIAAIQEQKKIIEEQLNQFSKGRQATQAYTNNY
jgi:hypothetical protein